MTTVYSDPCYIGGSAYKRYRAVLDVTWVSYPTYVDYTWTATVQMAQAAQYGVAIACEGTTDTGYLASSSSSYKDVKVITGTKRVYREKETVYLSFTAQAYGTTVSGYGSAGGSTSVTFDDYVSALASYAVSYNANGGSGAPASQTKWHGESLTLSATKPTRTGYTFKNWNTKADGSGTAYAAEASYTGNAALTLYAQWTANTYAISYNANGGSGAPSAQTKTHDVALTLSSTKPTRTNYTFVGWSKSSTATVATYSPGDSFTENATTTLYAVWSLAYTPPKIYLMQADRCTSNGTLDDFGTYAKVQFEWSCDQTAGTNNVKSITVGYRVTGATAWTNTAVSASGTSGSSSPVIGGGAISVESSYEIQITVTDNKGGTTTRTLNLHQAEFILDFKAGGSGIAIGKPAELDDTLEVAKRTIFSRGDEVDVGYTPSGYVMIGDPEGLHISMDSNEIQAKSDGFTASSLLLQSGGGSTSLGGTLSVAESIYMQNGKILCSKNNGGVDRSLVQLNASNQYFFGYGSYVNSEGQAYFDGNAVNIRSKGAIAITSPTAGLSSRQYGVNKVLASPGWYMTADQTTTLSEAVSAQPNGIVLVWSWYQSGAQNYAWNFHFIPKHTVASHSGTGFSAGSFNYDGHMAKYLYITDTTIRGYTGNTGSDTTGNATFNNSGWVLRYVLGV